VLKPGFGQTLPGRKLSAADATLTPKQLTAPMAVAKIYDFLDINPLLTG
jgi:hypothetical protein